MNLNVSPDKRGLLPESDVRILHELRQLLDITFAIDLAQGAKLVASNVRGGDPQFAAENVLDGKRDTYWATDDAIKTPGLVIDLGEVKTFDIIRLREDLPAGQRVEAFALDQWQDGQWREFFHGKTIGHQRLVRTESPLKTSKVRLRIVKAPVCPVISEMGLYLEPPDPLRPHR